MALGMDAVPVMRCASCRPCSQCYCIFKLNLVADCWVLPPVSAQLWSLRGFECGMSHVAALKTAEADRWLRRRSATLPGQPSTGVRRLGARLSTAACQVEAG